MRSKAIGGIAAQSMQALISLVLQIMVSRILGIDDFGQFAILYGIIVLATAVITGLVGDTLVVLDRSRHGIRAGLEGTLALVTASAAVIAGVLAWATGFVSGVDAVLFGAALAAFAVEEIVRRLLMARLAFPRVIATDLAGFVIALLVLGAVWLAQPLTLGAFLGAIAAGQAVAACVGWFLVPRDDRFLVRLGGADYAAVWKYGSWRGLQQTLRPAMFTATRLLVLGFAGLTAVGELEAARTYTSPLILVVGGFSSYLFVRFAGKHRDGEGADSLREADRVVLVLLGLTIVMGAIAVALAPLVGPLAFGVELNTVAVVAWVAYGASVAMVTPYGALGAVSGRQTAVFLIRLGDTVLGLAAATVILASGLSPATVPFALAVASLLGGIGLRWLAASSKDTPRSHPDGTPSFG
ncbi:hypothetical protein G5T42_04315 [Microbacterium sp. 4R-513]|uniref:lipopolysaccharide biosynthesis protein n=1 Tax=Microbacterium sp. 4R-513 TaxID=2567934 RepID=UPI0013E13E23|nr:hypothetical protein [Microbacterium sp. 4R-513]QIG38804.1 hypothetical protein G5T42_04315 [Microbacterium sp. 4R-513]